MTTPVETENNPSLSSDNDPDDEVMKRIHQILADFDKETKLLEAVNELFEKLKARQSFIEIENTEGRNFEILFEETAHRGKDMVLIQRETGKRFNISSKFLKNNHTFVPGKEAEVNHKTKEIFYIPEDLAKRGFMLSILHEVAHALRDEQKKTSKLEDLVAFTVATAKYLANVRLSIHTETSETGKKHTSVILDPQKSIRKLLPDHYQRNIRPFSAVDQERTAWAMALRLARRLQKEGFNVLEGFESAEQVREYIEYSLLTYDLVRISKQTREGKITSPDEFEFPFSKSPSGP